jgi:hypothetical protein
MDASEGALNHVPISLQSILRSGRIVVRNIMHRVMDTCLVIPEII